MIRQSHKPNYIKVNKKTTINGLLSHQEDKRKCEIIHNRDKNAVQKEYIYNREKTGHIYENSYIVHAM